MKMFKRFMFVMLMACSFSSFAAYYECELVSGRPTSCGSWADAQHYPVKQEDGFYKDCSITSGSASMCSGWSDRDKFPVKDEQGFYQACSLVSGRAAGCSGWYDGKAVVDR